MKIEIKDQYRFMMRWANMIDRCQNPENPMYSRYGGRGIKVCDRWLSFFNYLEDLPDNYFDKAQLDRIDNDSGYCKSNVKWSTREENSRNRNSNRWIEFNGERKFASDWAADIGITVSSLIERIDNWPLEDALTIKKGVRLHNRWDGHTKKPHNITKSRPVRLYEYEGKKLTMKELSKISLVDKNLIRKRINERGWDVKRAVETQV